MPALTTFAKVVVKATTKTAIHGPDDTIGIHCRAFLLAEIDENFFCLEPESQPVF